MSDQAAEILRGTRTAGGHGLIFGKKVELLIDHQDRTRRKINPAV